MPGDACRRRLQRVARGARPAPHRARASRGTGVRSLPRSREPELCAHAALFTEQKLAPTARLWSERREQVSDGTPDPRA